MLVLPTRCYRRGVSPRIYERPAPAGDVVVIHCRSFRDGSVGLNFTFSAALVSGISTQVAALPVLLLVDCLDLRQLT